MKADVGPLGSPWEALGKFPKICSRALGFESLLVGSWAMSRQTGRHQNLISRVLEEERECIEKMGEKCSKVGVARRCYRWEPAHEQQTAAERPQTMITIQVTTYTRLLGARRFWLGDCPGEL